MKIQLKRSNALDGGQAKQPTPAQMEYGELAVNYNKDDPSVFLKDSDNNIVQVGADVDNYYTKEEIENLTWDTTAADGRYLRKDAAAPAQTILSTADTTFNGDVNLQNVTADGTVTLNNLTSASTLATDADGNIVAGGPAGVPMDITVDTIYIQKYAEFKTTSIANRPPFGITAQQSNDLNDPAITDTKPVGRLLHRANNRNADGGGTSVVSSEPCIVSNLNTNTFARCFEALPATKFNASWQPFGDYFGYYVGDNDTATNVKTGGLNVGFCGRLDAEVGVDNKYNLYIDGSAPNYFNGGVQFDTAAGTSVLSYYEVGDFTPVFQNEPAGTTYTLQTGKYVKVGNLVNIYMELSYSGASGTASVRITLPFTSTAPSASGASGTGTVMAFNATGTTISGETVMAVVDKNTDRLSLMVGKVRTGNLGSATVKYDSLPAADPLRINVTYNTAD